MISSMRGWIVPWLAAPRAALLGAMALVLLGVAPVQAKLMFGTEEHLRQIQDVDIKGSEGEALYLGYKFSYYSFLLPYTMSDDGYVLGVRGKESFYRLNADDTKRFQDAGMLPTPLPPYEISTVDRVFGHSIWLAAVFLAFTSLLGLRNRWRKRRATPIFQAASAAHTAGDLDQAIAGYTQAIKIYPYFAEAYNMRGVAHESQGDLVQAMADQTKAIKSEAELPKPRMDRALLFVAQGQFDPAIADLTEVIKLTKDATAYYRRGQAYLAKDDVKRAIADLTEVIKKEPAFTEAYTRRAIAYDKADKLDLAQADRAKAAALARPTAEPPQGPLSEAAT